MGALLSTKELQKELNISRDKSYALMHAAAFPSIKIGRRYYVEDRKLRTWLDSYAHKSFAL